MSGPWAKQTCPKKLKDTEAERSGDTTRERRHKSWKQSNTTHTKERQAAGPATPALTLAKPKPHSTDTQKNKTKAKQKSQAPKGSKQKTTDATKPRTAQHQPRPPADLTQQQP